MSYIIVWGKTSVVMSFDGDIDSDVASGHGHGGWVSSEACRAAW